MLETDEFSRAWIKKSINVNGGDMNTAKKLALMQYTGGKTWTTPPWITWIKRWLTRSFPRQLHLEEQDRECLVLKVQGLSSEELW